MQIENIEELIVNFRGKKICYTHENLKTNTKSWIRIKKCIESLNLIRKLGNHIFM